MSQYTEIKTDLIINKLSNAKYVELSNLQQLNDNELYLITDTPDIKADKTYVDDIRLSTDENHNIVLKRSNGLSDIIDTSEFLKDRFLSSVQLKNNQIVFTFDPNSNIQPISVSLTSYISEYDSYIDELDLRLTDIENNCLTEDDKAQIINECLIRDEVGIYLSNDYLNLSAEHRITNIPLSVFTKNVATPITDNDAATKKYVDDIVGDIETLLQGV